MRIEDWDAGCAREVATWHHDRQTRPFEPVGEHEFVRMECAA